MVKQFTNFHGYELRKGCQFIAVVVGAISMFMAFILFFTLSYESHFMQVQDILNPNLVNYGGSRAFSYVTTFLGIKETIHIIICIVLYFGTRSDDAGRVRVWLRSSLLGICCLCVFGIYAVVLLFAADAILPAVGGVIFLAVLIPTKIYFHLVVNSYHNEITPSYYSGLYVLNMNPNPRSCQLVPPILTNRPAVVVVS